eukprot:TRINITY_DN1276_c0_g1_i2.p1 TRINITY_DN1276_c0_g1~~TRINITY_DN1276_c0_g1_i2.p1  ORF type:complete len:101 (-),score=1.59 TRINITY_DN1276_c0_g1_i2:913-1215(-)
MQHGISQHVTLPKKPADRKRAVCTMCLVRRTVGAHALLPDDSDAAAGGLQHLNGAHLLTRAGVHKTCEVHQCTSTAATAASTFTYLGSCLGSESAARPGF